MRILQLSDSHIRLPGSPLAGKVETLPFLERAVAEAGRFSLRPDAVILTGDVVDTLTVEEYRLARTALSRLDLPLWVLPGNHDLRENMRDVLGSYLGPQVFADRLSYVVDEYPVRIIALDSIIPQQGDGQLGAEQLGWLDRTLAGGPHRPTVIALHHPPFAVGIGFMDRLGLLDRDQLGEIVARNRQVVRVIAGHVHQTIVGQVGGAVAITAPSVAHQIPLDLTEESPETFTFEPPGFLLHQWDGKSLHSHHGYIGDYGPRYPFDG